MHTGHMLYASMEAAGVTDRMTQLQWRQLGFSELWVHARRPGKCPLAAADHLGQVGNDVLDGLSTGMDKL